MAYLCKIEHCSKPLRARGWCVTHWQKWKRNGDPEKTVKRYEQHGLTGDPAYPCWKSAKQRVFNSNCPYYNYYGGRGITMCSGVSNSFKTFKGAIGDRPSGDHSIDRVDNDGGYWCGSCEDCLVSGHSNNMRWATKSEQQRNSRRYEVV